MNKQDLQTEIKKGLEYLFQGEGSVKFKEMLKLLLVQLKAYKPGAYDIEKIDMSKVIGPIFKSLGLSDIDTEGFLSNPANFDPELWQVMQEINNERDKILADSSEKKVEKATWVKT